jgi:integrase
MKYYLENGRVVIRGKNAKGSPYRLFVKLDNKVIILAPDHWSQKKQTVKGNPVLNTYLKNLRVRLESMVLQNKAQDVTYSIPEAWAELFPTSKQAKEKLSNKVVECIRPYLQSNSGNKSAGYLRHYTQLQTELTAWNKSIEFDKLNELSLNSYLSYLKGEGSPPRKPLKSSTIGHHFKHLRQVAKYAAQRGVKVDPTVNDFNPGKVVYSSGCFDLTFEELMILWHYQPEGKYEEIVLDHSLLEAFTGIRTGDIYSIKEDGSEHGIKCGDISAETIGYRDRKNQDMVKYVTRHKFNERIIQKYMTDDPNAFLLPPVSQQAANRLIKTIAKKCGLDRGIRRGSEIQPMHEVIASHCFRASYANVLYRQGITGEMVSSELGHAAANVTIKHYLKFSNRHELIREKMNQLEIFRPEEKNILKKVV